MNRSRSRGTFGLIVEGAIGLWLMMALNNPGFSLETINCGAIGREFFGKELQRDFAAKARVDAGDHSHASLPN